MKRFFKVTPALLLIAAMLLSMLAVFPVAAATTNGTGYDSADDVVYKTYSGYIANWGAREEDCVFLSSKAQSFYTGNYTFDVMSQKAGGTTQANAPSSALYSELNSFMSSKHTHNTSYSETKDLYKYTDCTFSNTSTISSFYSGTSISGTWDGGSTWNREHTWPNSKGLGGSDENDIMMLRPTSTSENSSRGNTAYGESSSYYNPNKESNGAHDLRGDVARIMLYTYVRWGNTNRMWGTNGVMESMDVMLKWMAADPVDTWEMGRNDAVQSITGTRNVFVDYPEYAWLLFGKSVPTDMVTPSGLASGGNIEAGTGGSDIVTPDPTPSVTVTVVENPEVGVAYKLMTDHETVGKKLYLTGAVANKDYYFASTEDASSAVDVYLEAADSGYKVYFTLNGTKTYITVTQNNTYYNAGFVTSASDAAVFTWNTTYNTLTTTVSDGTECYLGMYDTYETFSASKISYASSDGSFTSALVTVEVSAETQPTVTEPTESETTTKPVDPTLPDASFNKLYTFADYTAGAQYGDETHKLDDYLTVTTHNGGAWFTTQLRLYQSDDNDGWAILTLADGNVFGSLTFNAGHKAAHLMVYGSNDGNEWTLIEDVATTTAYKDYTVDTAGYPMIKLDAESNQVRIASINATIYCDEEDLPVETETQPTVTEPTTTKPVESETEPTTTKPVIPDVDPDGTVTATLTFDSTANRTSFDENQQVWEGSGITLTNDKTSTSTAIADYSNPLRMYKNSDVTVTAGGNKITKIVFTAAGEAKYKTAIGESLTAAGYNVTVDGNDYIITPNSETVAFTLTAQGRLASITVTYAWENVGGEDSDTEPDVSETEPAVSDTEPVDPETTEPATSDTEPETTEPTTDPETTEPTCSHEAGKWEVIVEPTEEYEGLREFNCPDCGHYDSETLPIVEAGQTTDGEENTTEPEIESHIDTILTQPDTTEPSSEGATTTEGGVSVPSGCTSTVSYGLLAVLGLAVIPMLAKSKKKE
ncbi:MAG: endonuclease [Clostridia bacterium]|nr:endonuclease [Clostridia bacterium]